MFSPKNRHLHFIALGLLLSFFGFLCALCWENIFNRLAEQNLILRPESKITKLWQTPPNEMLIKFDFYLFNWTNPEEFDNLSIKPKLEQVGPYHYLEVPEKTNIKWHSENATVSYRRKSRYFFDEIKSNGTLNDPIVTINSLAVAIAARSKYWSPMRRGLADFALRIYHDDITLRKTVDELLFKGFEDSLLNFAKSIPASLSNLYVPFDKFGYFYPRNDSYYNDYNVYTGADDIKNIGQINTWNFRKSTDYYAHSCAQIKGSVGEFQPPHLKKNTIVVFVPEFCRPMTLDYNETVEVEGILGYKYVGGLRTVDNGTLFPENACANCNGECLPSGVMNVSSCWYGVTLFVSYPHFYNADPIYSEQFEGIKSDKKQHELYVILDPRSSLILDVGIRIQTNVFVEPTTALRVFRSKRKILFPLLWVNGSTRITPELAADLKAIYAYVHYGQFFGCVCCALGITVALYLTIMQYLKNRTVSQFLLESNNIQQEQRQQQNKSNAVLKQLPEGSPLRQNKISDSDVRSISDMNSNCGSLKST